MKPVLIILSLTLACSPAERERSSAPSAAATDTAGEAKPTSDVVTNPQTPESMNLGDEPDGSKRAVQIEGRTIQLTPFRVMQKSGLSDSQCGILVDGQRLLTLGAGDLDAYTCLEIVDVKALPSTKAGPRLGLRYEAASPNTSLQTATVIVRDADGRWAVVPEATTTFENLTEKTWSALEAALSAQGQ